jgi:hypothetical protein
MQIESVYCTNMNNLPDYLQASATPISCLETEVAYKLEVMTNLDFAAGLSGKGLHGTDAMPEPTRTYSRRPLPESPAAKSACLTTLIFTLAEAHG